VGPRRILDVVPCLPLHRMTDCLSKLNSQVFKSLQLGMIPSLLNHTLLLGFYILAFFNCSLSKTFHNQNSVVLPVILVTCTDQLNHLEVTFLVTLSGSFASIVTLVVCPLVSCC
jgi:hypothetical protein